MKAAIERDIVKGLTRPIDLGGIIAAPDAGVAFPMAGPTDIASLDLDFISQRYSVNGVQQAVSYLVTVAGTPTVEADGLKADTGDQLSMPDQSWFNNSEGTIVIELTDTGHANDGDRVAFSLHEGSGATQQRFEILTQYTGGLSDRVIKAQALGYGGVSIGGGISGRVNDWYRAVINWKFGSEATMQVGGQTISLGTWPTVWSNPMARTGLGYWRTSVGSNYLNAAGGGRLRRVTVFKTRQPDAWGVAKSLETRLRNLHFLGDSFIATGAELPTVMHKSINDTFRAMTFDGVSSSTLAQQADRFDLTPQYWDRQVIIINGSADGNDAATLIAAYNRIAARCTKYRPIYVQPNMGNGTDYYTGQPNRVTWDAVEAAVKSAIGAAYYIPTLAGMQAAGDGSANDNADIANGIWPRSLTSDGLHPNTTGAPAEANIIKSFLYAAGW